MEQDRSYFKAICKISRAFGTTHNLEELLDLIVDSAIETMQVKAARLFLYEEEQEEFIPVAQRGLSDKYVRRGLTHPSTIIPVLVEDGFLYSQNAVTDDRLSGHEAKKAEGIVSILVVPVKVRGKLIGGLSLFAGERRDFSEDEIEFATAIAEQGGMAIANSQLIERVMENSNMFLDLAVNINSSLDVKKILHILTADVADSMNVKASSILLVDEKNKSLEYVASYGLSEKYLRRGQLSIDPSVEETLAGNVVRVRDMSADPRVSFKKEKQNEGIVSILSIPVKTKEKVIGVLRLYTGAPREFSDEETTMVTAVAQLGGLAIRNASMYLLLEKDMKHLQEDIWSHRSWF